MFGARLFSSVTDKPLTPPQSFNTLLVDRPTRCPKHLGDAAITVAPILPGQFDYVRGQSCFVVRCLRDLALRGAMLAKNQTGASFGHAQFSDHMIHAGPAARGA